MEKKPLKLLELQSMNKAALHQMLIQMIKFNNDSCQKPQSNSKLLIQPIHGSDKYYIADLTNPILDQTQYTAPFQFYPNSGFIHLSKSLVLAGGYNKSMYLNTVNQLHQNHDIKPLPPMKYRRANFPLVEFNDGKIIAAICGQYCYSQIANCQVMHNFQNWSDLPSMDEECEGVSACSVGLSRIYAFGGKPYFRNDSIAFLDLNRLDKKWVSIVLSHNPFKERCIDSACYLPEKRKIIVFGSYKNSLFVQMDVLDDMSIQITLESQMLPFDYRQYYLMVWKLYNGSLYSFSNEKFWRYDDEVWK